MYYRSGTGSLSGRYSCS